VHREPDLQGSRIEAIVRVVEDHKLAAARGEAGVARGAHTLISLRDEANAGKLGRHLCAAVGRSVDHHDDLQRRVSLIERSLQRFPKETLGVVTRNDNGNRSCRYA